MPVASLGQHRLLVHGLLDPVFPDLRESGRQGFRNDFRRMVLGHRQDGHLVPRYFRFCPFIQCILDLGFDFCDFIL